MTSSLIARGAPKRTPVFYRRVRGGRHGLNYEARAPIAGLTQAGDGTFYGTTSAGGAAACGTAFTITGTGSLTTLHSSASVIAGRWPSGLIPPGDGKCCGTTDDLDVTGIQGGRVFKMGRRQTYPERVPPA
jgi:uncharacterized repeat protein (TIGR03803 family)